VGHQTIENSKIYQPSTLGALTLTYESKRKIDGLVAHETIENHMFGGVCSNLKFVTKIWD
jgi:hypothetical protein